MKIPEVSKWFYLNNVISLKTNFKFKHTLVHKQIRAQNSNLAYCIKQNEFKVIYKYIYYKYYIVDHGELKESRTSIQKIGIVSLIVRHLFCHKDKKYEVGDLWGLPPFIVSN